VVDNGAWGISDRSGMRFPIKEMIKEPGTNYFIHKSESDGAYNAVDHPQAHLTKYATLSGDPKPIKNAHPDISHTQDIHITDSFGNYLTDQYESPIEVY